MQERKNGLGVIIVAGLLLLAVRRDAQAKTVDVTWTDSGTTSSTAFSFDGANLAGQAIAAGEQKPGGRFTLEGISQDAPDGESCTLTGGTPNAGIETAVVDGNAVMRFKPSGDLLYLHETSATTCIDLSGTPPFRLAGSASFVITGGTGKYAGATGTETGNLSGVILSLPSEPGFGVFAAFNGTVKGTLTTP
jgi:hypothetical protein